MPRIPVYKISIPEYTVEKKPDFAAIGKKIDAKIKDHFLDKKIAIRCLGSQEHPGKSVDDIIKIIKTKGTDRYDMGRSGDRYENVENQHIDFFALDFMVKQNSVIMEKFIEPFYTWPLNSGSSPVRIDIAIIYDFSELRRVLHRYEGRIDIKRDGFIFKNPKNKKGAILGILKIL